MKRVTKVPLFEWYYKGNLYKEGKPVKQKEIVGYNKCASTKCFDVTPGYFIIDGDPFLSDYLEMGKYFFKAEIISEQEFVKLLANNPSYFRRVYDADSPKPRSNWFHIYECTTELEKLICLKSNNYILEL